MNAFNVTLTISGTNDEPERRTERIIAGHIEHCVETVAAVLRDASFVCLKVEIEKDERAPFPFVP